MHSAHYQLARSTGRQTRRQDRTGQTEGEKRPRPHLLLLPLSSATYPTYYYYCYSTYYPYSTY